MIEIKFCPKCKVNEEECDCGKFATVSDSPALAGCMTAIADPIKPIEDYASDIFLSDKPKYDELLFICQRLRKLMGL